MRVDDLELSVRAGNVLRAAGIETIEQFMSLNRRAVMAMPKAGVRTWREIEDVQRGFARHEDDFRRCNDERIKEFCGALNLFLDTHEDYGVRLVEGRVVPMRVLKGGG
jgi:hypothetical protein